MIWSNFFLIQFQKNNYITHYLNCMIKLLFVWKVKLRSKAFSSKFMFPVWKFKIVPKQNVYDKIPSVLNRWCLIDIHKFDFWYVNTPAYIKEKYKFAENVSSPVVLLIPHFFSKMVLILVCPKSMSTISLRYISMQFSYQE